MCEALRASGSDFSPDAQNRALARHARLVSSRRHAAVVSTRSKLRRPSCMPRDVVSANGARSVVTHTKRSEDVASGDEAPKRLSPQPLVERIVVHRCHCVGAGLAGTLRTAQGPPTSDLGRAHLRVGLQGLLALIDGNCARAGQARGSLSAVGCAGCSALSGTVITAHGERRITRSATEPTMACAGPVLPCAPITIRS